MGRGVDRSLELVDDCGNGVAVTLVELESLMGEATTKLPELLLLPDGAVWVDGVVARAIGESWPAVGPAELLEVGDGVGADATPEESVEALEGWGAGALLDDGLEADPGEFAAGATGVGALATGDEGDAVEDGADAVPVGGGVPPTGAPVDGLVAAKVEVGADAADDTGALAELAAGVVTGIDAA